MGRKVCFILDGSVDLCSKAETHPSRLQFQGQFVPISWRPIPGIVAAYIMVMVWSPCSHVLAPGGGFSLYETAHSMWLRILSTALEKELKVFDFAY